MTTRKDIAQKAGVSVSVVSRALNNSGYVEASKKERILRIAEELGYHPNPVAVSLMTQRTKQILFYCREIRNAFTLELYEGMVKAAKEQDYLVMFHGSLDFKSIRSTMVDGIIFPSEAAAEIYQNMVGKIYRLPAVSAAFGNTFYYPKGMPMIECDCWKGMELIFQYLRERGHHRIALVMPYDISHEEIRIFAWKDQIQYELKKDEIDTYYLGISKKSLPGDKRVLEFGEEREEGDPYIAENFWGKGRLAAHIFQERRLDATAVICFNDEMAMGFLQEIQKLGYRVPENLSIVSFDGTFVRRYGNPILTSLSLQPEKIGEKCVEILLKEINKEPFKYKYKLTPRLLEGESVQKIKR